MSADKILRLQEELKETLAKARRNFKVLSISRRLVYLCAVVYFVGFMIFIGSSWFMNPADNPFVHNYEQNPTPSFLEANPMVVYIVPLFVLMYLAIFGMQIFYKKFATQESVSVNRIVRELFPDATMGYNREGFSKKLVFASRFFGNNTESMFGYPVSCGMLTLKNNGNNLYITDILVPSAQSKLTNNQIGGMAMVGKAMFRGVTADRTENVVAKFRGIFATAKLPKAINGAVVILPDKLEGKLDYMAHSVQSLKDLNGCRLVVMEDVDFEREFAVYSSDEVLARYVLTPGMMRRITESRMKFGRGIMFSFVEDRFYYAVSMPEGFLTLSQQGLKQGTTVGDIYENIETARAVMSELKLN